MSQDTYTLKQNVITAGVKAHVLGADYKFRPYVAGGGGYAMASLNYPDQTLNQIPGGYQPQSYSSDAFVAISGRFDATVAKNVSLEFFPLLRRIVDQLFEQQPGLLRLQPGGGQSDDRLHRSISV